MQYDYKYKLMIASYYRSWN